MTTTTRDIAAETLARYREEAKRYPVDRYAYPPCEEDS